LLIVTLATCFFGALLLLFVASRIVPAEYVFALSFIIIPVYLLSYFRTGRLYAALFRLSCPQCSKKLQMHYRPGRPVSYECQHCGYAHHTGIAFGGPTHW
jgi:hypothetical protein